MKGISIIICTFNGAERLPDTFSAIAEIKFEHPWEVIVVDNASKDNTSQVAKDFFNSFSGIDGRLVFEAKAGLTSARQAGWKAAKYSVVLFCDDDNWLSPNYLAIGFNHFERNSKLGILGGCGVPVTIGDFPSWFSEFSHSYAVGMNGRKSGKQKLGSAHYGAGCYYLKAALEKLDESGLKMVLTDRKGKDLFSGGDVELCFLVQLLGYQLWIEEGLKFRHFIPVGRLNWEYYLRLKRGIASSFPLLNSYKVFFGEQPSTGILLKLIYRQFWIALKGVILCSFRSLVKPSLRNEVQLMESKTKVISFFRFRKDTIGHFKYLKEVFS